jgi:uncharacterized protein YceK
VRHSILAIIVVAMSGCASITTSDVQNILVTTSTETGDPLEKADCTLQSPRGHWKVATPGSVMVFRSAEDILVDCRKDGHGAGFAKVISRVHGGMLGNVIFGGVVGVVIDHSRGTGYQYPSDVRVVMGKSLVIDRRDEQQAETKTVSVNAEDAQKQEPECTHWKTGTGVWISSCPIGVQSSSPQ